MKSPEQRTISKISRRLLPLLMVSYFVAYLDRVNLGFAGASMSMDLGFTSTVFGNAAGIFFIAYFLFEVPSNLALERFGARRWIARIMLSWGVLSMAQAWVGGATSFNVVRFLLGMAEAGFFPGVIFYLTLWFPAAYRARIVGWFMFAVPISTVIGSPISGYILDMDGFWGMHGWQWLFILEALPALALTFFVLLYLPDRPKNAKWLTPEECNWLQTTLDAEQRHRESIHKISWKQALLNWKVISLGIVYMGITVPLYGLGFFLPQIIKGFGGLSNVEIGFINAFPYLVGAIAMVFWTRWSDARRERKMFLLIPASLLRPRGRGAVQRTHSEDGGGYARRVRHLHRAARVLDRAHRVAERRCRGGWHRMDQFDRQSRRLHRSHDLRRAERPDGQRFLRGAVPRAAVSGGVRARTGRRSRQARRTWGGGSARVGIALLCLLPEW